MFAFLDAYLQEKNDNGREIKRGRLKEFLQAWLPHGKFSTDWQELLKVTEHEVIAAGREALADSSAERNSFAKRLLGRQHFRTVYELVSAHKTRKPNIFNDLIEAAGQEFGADNIRSDHYGPKSETNDFPVQTADGSIESSLQVSGVIETLPAVEIGFILAESSMSLDIKQWLDQKVKSLLKL